MEDYLYLFDDVDLASGYEIECDPLDEVRISQMIRSYLPNVNIKRVKKVNNKFMEDMYHLKKEEYKSRYGAVDEKLLVHATDASKVASILQDNLDWRRVTRNKYGKGVSFSEDADYANYHSNRGNGFSRAFIVAKVLIANACIGHYSLEVPSGNITTAKSSNGKVFVKFNDNEFLPVNVVYYDAPDKTTSQHHKLGRLRRRR